MIRYISLFSGIEAVSCALNGMEWEPVAFSEIDPFPSAVLAARYPQVPNLGDITKIDWTDYVGSADVVWGGSPCQSFSLAGNRLGLKGASGLMWEYVRAIRELRPKYFVWENVPGALSSSHGEDFRCLLASMDDLGYGLAWRVLDAQFYGVAQRRRRVFVVGSLGTMRCAEVLFEPESLRRDYPSSREKRKALTGRPQKRAGTADESDGKCLTPWDCQSKRIYPVDSVWPTLYAAPKGGSINQAVALDFHQQDGRCKVSKTPDVSATITAHAGTGGNNVPMVMCRGSQQANASIEEELSPTLTSAAGTSGNNTPIVYPKTREPVTMLDTQAHASVERGICGTLTAHASKDAPLVAGRVRRGFQVRRLTTVECERLQGFPDGWTDIPYKGREHPADSVRYKALGNSMAVPVMRRLAVNLEKVMGGSGHAD